MARDTLHTIIYETITWGITIVIPVFLLYSRVPRVLTLILALVWIVVAYGSFVEPRIIVINNQSLDRPEINQPIRLALVSDLHYGLFKNTGFAKKTVKKILEQKPDLVLVAGDLIAGKANELKFLNTWKDLAAAIPTYYAFGNHEFNAYFYEFEPNYALAEAVSKKLSELGIKILENESVKINVRGQEFYLIGLGDPWSRRLDVRKAFSSTGGNLLKIALAHNPDVIRQVQNKTDLLLAGHTHGAQVRLPFFGPIGKIPDDLGQRFDKGWFNFGNTQLFITSGLGETNARARLFNPPEIVLIEIQ